MIWLLLSVAVAGDLEGAWQAALATSDQAVLVRGQADIDAITTQRAVAGVLPKVQAQANLTFNQYDVVFDPAGMIPEQFRDLLGDAFNSDPIVIQKKVAWDGNLTILQPLIDASAWARIAAAKAVVKAGRAREDEGISALRTGVAQAYWSVIVTREATEVAEQALANATAHRAIVAAQVEVGTMPKQALLQADLAVSRAQREITAVWAQRRAAEAALSVLTGWPEDEPLVRPGPRELPFGSAEEAVAQAKTVRPAVRAAYATLLAARRNRLATDLGWVPDIQGRFTESYTENTSFVGKNWMWNAGINFTWTIFDGGYLIADQREQAIRVRMAQAAYDNAVDQAAVDARSAWDDLVRAQAAYTAVEREVELAKENLRLVELQLREGLATFQDVDDARLSLESAEVGLIRESMAVDLATLQLLSVTGLLAD